MQNYDDDWDDLDDYELQQCVLKENEILSQNPQLCKSIDLHSNVSKEISKRWINNQFNSFINDAHTSKTNFSNLARNNLTSEKQTSNLSTFNKPFSDVSKKSYKPLKIETTSSSNLFIEKNNDKPNNDLDFNSLKGQLEQVLKEKANLEEENLLKQGEVFNLRNELKRKESSLQTERVDQCIALEAAEKRGKEKATRTINDLESKVKKLEKEVDRFEGDILFKNREIEELLVKCKQSNVQSSNSTLNRPKCISSSPSPKKRKLDHISSPNKSSFNFADRFDFGEKKKVVKNVHVQTEKELIGKQNRLRIKVTSSKGSVSGGRKAFYLLSSHGRKDNELLNHENNSANQNNILSHLISSVESKDASYLSNSERLLVKHICDNLENLVKAMHENNTERMKLHTEKYDDNFLLSSIPLLKMLSIIKTDNKNIIQNALKILCHCIEEFLKDKTKNVSGIITSLKSLSSVLNSCSELTQEMCNTLLKCLSKCCEIISVDILPSMMSNLISGISHEVFRRKICTNTTEKCLLSSFCNLVKKTSNKIKPEGIINELAVLLSKLLSQSSALTTSSACNCSFSLLTVFINNLYSIVKNLSKDEEWHHILIGLKILHAWKTKDKNLLEKASQLNSFPVLMSSVTKKANLLKSKGILDNFTWELIYNIYEIDES